MKKHDSLRSISFYLYWPNKRRSDDDNRIKILMDALVRGGLVKDDCWTCVREKHFFNELDRDNPRIVVEWEAG